MTKSPANAADEPALPETLDAGFMCLSRGIDKKTGYSFIQCVAKDHPVTWAGLYELLQFVDNFVDEHRDKYFGTLYDLRELNWPTTAMVWHCLQWGSDSEREDIWQNYNVSCKIVIQDGFRFMFTKHILATFFSLTPPACKIYLFTDIDQNEEEAVIFYPPEKPLEEPLRDLGCSAEQVSSARASMNDVFVPADNAWLIDFDALSMSTLVDIEDYFTESEHALDF